MGTVTAEITVKNAYDLTLAGIGQIPENKVRTATFTAMVDTGATTLFINEEIFQQLGLLIVETCNINTAGGGKIECKVTSPIHIQWKNRYAAVTAVVLHQGNPLFGAIPLEFMDLIVDPVRRELVGAHGDEVVPMAM